MSDALEYLLEVVLVALLEQQVFSQQVEIVVIEARFEDDEFREDAVADRQFVLAPAGEDLGSAVDGLPPYRPDGANVAAAASWRIRPCPCPA